jgi:predicted phage terminase large subunit-like protein
MSALMYMPSPLLIEAEYLRRNFYAFVKAAWKVIEPGTDFVDGWHIGVMCAHLQAITEQKLGPRDEAATLIINIPPGSTKSTVVSVMWPAWEWISDPTLRYLTASRESSLAERDALATRRLITSDWYRSRWAYVYALTGDQNAKTRYENDKRGYRLTTSPTAGGTGEGGSRVIVDDPHDMAKIFSDVYRETALSWWDNTMSSRLRHPVPSKNARVLVMQRGAMLDMTGHWLTKYKNAVHLILPMEWDGVRRKSPLGYYDPRTKRGELLCEKRFSRKTVNQQKTDFGEYGSSGQLQQAPIPLGGGLIKRDWIKLWPAKRPLPAFTYVVQSYDTAFKEKLSNDPTGHGAFGLFLNGPDKIPNVMLIDAWDERMRYPDLRKKVKADYKLRYGGDANHPEDPGKRVDLILIEDKSSGIALVQDLQLLKMPVYAYNPGDADKHVRLHAVSPLIEVGLLWVPESTVHPGSVRSWAQPFVNQVCSFPGGEHDEYVDILSQTFLYLRNAGMISAPIKGDDDDDDVEEFDAPVRQRPANPYAA